MAQAQIEDPVSLLPNINSEQNRKDLVDAFLRTLPDGYLGVLQAFLKAKLRGGSEFAQMRRNHLPSFECIEEVFTEIGLVEPLPLPFLMALYEEIEESQLS